MSGIDLDAMRGRWQSANRDLDAQLALDVAAVRTSLQGRTRTAFRPRVPTGAGAAWGTRPHPLASKAPRARSRTVC